MIKTSPLIYYLFIPVCVLIGISIGSFLNVCIYRTINKNFFKKKRSYCPKCQHELKLKDNIPIFSFLFLKGKCRYCSQKISFRYPLVEILNTILYLLIFIVFKFSYLTLLYSILVSALIVMIFIDIDTMMIPDRIQITILILGLISFIPGVDTIHLWRDKLIGMVAISLFTFILAVLTKGMGLGDVKLYFVLGLLLSWQYVIIIFFISVISGAFVGLIIVSKNKKKGENSMKKAIPFGPYIAFATFITIFIGEHIVSLYAQLFKF